MITRKWMAGMLAVMLAVSLAGLAGCGSSAKSGGAQAGPPVLRSISPNSGFSGDEVTLKGESFGDGVGSSVDFTGNRAEVVDWQDTYITVYVPLVVETGPVVVSTPAGDSNPVGFTVTIGST